MVDTVSPRSARPGAALPDAAAVMAQAGAENFPVASRLLPRASRAHLLAIYGFARLVDDLGDEAAGDRLALLDWLERELDRVYGGDPGHPLMRTLAATVRACGLPREPFARLIEANRQDQRVRSYATYDELLGYCELSANPVGALVLGVFGADTPERRRLSDAVCTGLQLVEHWQDVAEDRARARVYLPAEDLARFEVDAAALAAPTSGPRVRALIAFECGRARGLIDRGAPLARTLSGRPAWAIAGFVAGGRAALAAIARADFDVLGTRPRPTRARGAAHWLAALAERPRR